MPATMNDVFPDVEAVLTMPAEELGACIMEFLRRSQQDNDSMVNRHNFIQPTNNHILEYAGAARAEEVCRALTEAWVWLEQERMLAPRPGHTDRDWIYITKRGERYRTQADVSAYRHQRLLRDQLLDPELRERVLPLFRPDDYDTPVFKAFHIVEVRTRTAAGLPQDLVGVKLMREAFAAPGGPLTDGSLPTAEQQAMQHLFAGAIGLFKNPSSHRNQVKTAEEAAGRIICANVLLGVLANLPKPAL